MKLKKKVKRNLTIVLIAVIVIAAGFGVYNYLKYKNNKTEKVKIVNTIKEYGYNLKDSKTPKYKKMFEQLKEILSEDNVDEEKYVKQISKMFIYDFYSLNDKSAKTDVGGVDFVHSTMIDNFLTNAQSTYYKYVESNIYNQRKQTLPVVSKINIESVENKEFEYGEEKDENSYEVNVTWDYTKEEFSDYQKSATLIFIHEGKKLSLAQLSEEKN